MNNNVEKYIKWVIGAVAIGAGGFAALFLIKSVIALAITVFGGLIIINGAPVFAQWAAQMKIKGVKYLAMKNPVEDLQLLYAKKTEELTAFAQAITEFSVEVKDYKDKLVAFVQRRPEKAAEFKKTYDSMQNVLDIRTNKLKEAKAKLKDFELVIIEAQDIWDMTQAAMKANRAMKKFDGADPMDEIRQRTALDSVTSSLNQVMSELETSMALDYNDLEAYNKPALENNPSDVINVNARVIETEKSFRPYVR